MRRTSKLSFIAAIAAVAATLAGFGGAGVARAQALPAWMAGSWCAHRPTEVIEEVWLAPAGGLMLGMARTTPRSGQRTQFEFLRIELHDGTPV